MGYPVPSVGHADAPWGPYALAVLASVLDGGQSARLARNLVRGSEVAASASAGYSIYRRLPGLLTLAGLPAAGHDAEAVEAALREEVARLREEPVPAAELARVQTQVVASEVYEKDSVFYQAMRLGMLAAIGLHWRLDEEYVARIRAVTPEQVRAVARKYLRDEVLTVATLEPIPLDPAAGATPEVAHVR
jgi:zinc protease